MQYGHVVHWNGAYGKIRGDDRREVFVHVTELIDVLELRRGQRVEYEDVASPRGPRAINVVVFELWRPLQQRG
jgi:cold shock CspA family protein